MGKFYCLICFKFKNLDFITRTGYWKMFYPIKPFDLHSIHFLFKLIPIILYLILLTIINSQQLFSKDFIASTKVHHFYLKPLFMFFLTYSFIHVLLFWTSEKFFKIFKAIKNNKCGIESAKKMFYAFYQFN